MSYDPLLSQPKDRVRNLIGDTDTTHEILHDREVDFFVSVEANELIAASRAAMACAARFARDTDFRFSTLWQDASQAYRHFMELAESLKDVADEQGTTGIEFVSSVEGTINDIPRFDIAMHDYEEAVDA